MKETKIIIVDDSLINRRLLKLFLKSMPEVKVIGEASDGMELLNILPILPDANLIIMDIEMPNMDGIEATKRVRQFYPKLKVLCNSFYVDAHHIQKMIEAGACGYIRKDSSLDSYKQAINTIINHGIYLSEDINEKTYREVFIQLKNNMVSKRAC
jgi:DNA-binding NarL/FixJ family response regulator